MSPLLKFAFIVFLISRSATLTKWKLPDDFVFGLDILAYQIKDRKYENKGARDIIPLESQSIPLKDKNNKIVDYYPIFLDWVKILPEGYTSQINYTAITHYEKMVDTLLLQGTEPIITLSSGNLPSTFAPLGGWTNPVMVQYFASYVRQIFKIFGNRIKRWITFHEPRVICQSFEGLIGDDFPLGLAEYLCAHNILKAHAEAYHIYDKEFRMTQNGKVSITLDIVWSEPADATNPDDIRAAEQNMQFQFGLYANPIIHFDYPRIVMDRIAKRSKLEGFTVSRLPAFTYAEKIKLSGSCDYLQISYHKTDYVTVSQEVAETKPNVQTDSGGMSFENVNPKNEKKTNGCGFRQLLNWIEKTYNTEVVMIDNFHACFSRDNFESVNCFKAYLRTLAQAISEDNVNIKGYYLMWDALLDFSDANKSQKLKEGIDYFKNITKFRIVN